MLVTPLKARLSSEAGQVVVLFAMLLPVLFGLGAVVLDIGNWYVHKRHLQTQVDAAAFAAATGFSGCFVDPAAANLAIASTALSYAGDTARDPAARNQQVQDAESVRVTLNSQRYWAAGDTSTPTATGYGSSTDAVGDNSAGTPCATSTLDVKATDFDAPKLFSWLGIRPDIKAHARVEIHKEAGDMGFLPLAVPEIDPNFVYAIFVDYTQPGTQIPLRVQKLKKDPTYVGLGSSFPYSAWDTDLAVPNNTEVPLRTDSSHSDSTGVVILVSKADTAPSTSGTLNQICTQAPTELVQCYSGTGTSGYDGAATTQGLAMIHSFDGRGATADTPLIRNVTLGLVGCTGGLPGPGNLLGSYPYYINDDQDCTVQVTAQVDFGTADPPGPKTIQDAQNQGGVCADLGSGWTLTGVSPTAPYNSTWTRTLTVSVAGGHQTVDVTAADKTGGVLTNCNNRNHSDAATAMSYATDDSSGPVGYINLTAQGPNPGTGCPAGSGVADPHSTWRGNYCYSVVVGLDQPLAQKSWDTPPIVIRFASKSTRKGGSGTANLNGSLLCDAGRTLEETFETGCYTMYDYNYVSTTPPCSPGAYCWKDVLCSAYPPSSLPPATEPPNPICIAAKNGQVQAFQAGLYDRFESPGNSTGGCSRNNWPTTQAEADAFFGSQAFTTDSRYVTLVITDNTAFSSSNTAEPIKYFAGFYVTGWDTDNGSGKPKGCYGYPPKPGNGACGNPNNDAHPFLGCLAGRVVSGDNGDMWGHWARKTDFTSTVKTTDDLCDLTSASVENCGAVLVE
jgi:Flp pilus assembly protein TadG